MDSLKICVDSLKEQEYIFEKILISDFLEIHEKELSFDFPIKIKGKAYLSDDFLILNFSCKTFFKMPCSVCNTFTTIPLTIENDYETVPLNSIKNGTYDIIQSLREAIILKLPQFIECENGCPERKNIEKFFKKPKEYFPFENIGEKNGSTKKPKLQRKKKQ